MRLWWLPIAALLLSVPGEAQQWPLPGMGVQCNRFENISGKVGEHVTLSTDVPPSGYKPYLCWLRVAVIDATARNRTPAQLAFKVAGLPSYQVDLLITAERQSSWTWAYLFNPPTKAVKIHTDTYTQGGRSTTAVVEALYPSFVGMIGTAITITSPPGDPDTWYQVGMAWGIGP